MGQRDAVKQAWILLDEVEVALFSGIELKAFNAPLLAQEHPNAEVAELVRAAGNKPVRYGEVVVSSESSFDKSSDYGNADTVGLRQLALAIADPASVQPLGKRRR